MTADTSAPQTSTLVSTREVPWMKLGKLTETAMTAAEAAKIAKLDFRVEKRPIWFGGSDDVAESQPDHRIHERCAVVNAETNQWLGIMSSQYPVLQYAEAFDFMDTISPTYVAAGSLKGGRQGFMVVQAPQTINVLDGEDPHDLFLVLRTSHDGSRAIEVMVMPLRNRCMNQLTLQSFTAGVPHRWSVKHTTTMQAKLNDAQDALQKMGEYAKRYEATAEKLASMHVTDDTAAGLLRGVLPNRPRREEQIERIMNMWKNSDTVGYSGTGWGLLNGVSDYYDWGRAGGSPESRFVNALQGPTTSTLNRVAARLLTRV